MSVNLTYKVMYSTSKTPSTRVNETSFGDSYRQVTVDGINYQEETWDVSFVPTSPAETTSLEALLLNSLNGTSNYLLWTGPGESTAKYYTAHNVNKQFLGPSCYKMYCQLRREFPLV